VPEPDPTLSRVAGSSRRERLFDMLLRTSVALVWLYQGLWSKLLGGSPSQGDVVKSTLGWTRFSASSLLRAIGAIEVLLAVWVLTGYWRRLSAITQTGLLVAMNAGGLVLGTHAHLRPEWHGGE
jgi:uncharacterized membrane protein YphA (DoxX/SURF4 family)